MNSIWAILVYILLGIIAAIATLASIFIIPLAIVLFVTVHIFCNQNP